MKENLSPLSPNISPFSSLLSPLSSQIIICVLLLFLGCTGNQRNTDSPDTPSYIHTVNLCDSVVMVGTGWDNVTALSTQKGIVVIDAGISYSLTAEYRKVIEKRFNRKNFAYLINTHPHHDHTRGNPVFSDAMIVGHTSFLTGIPDIWKDPAGVKSRASESIAWHQALLDSLEKDSPEWREALCNKLCYEHLYRDASEDPTFAVPELTFDDTLTIRAGDMTFCLLYFGKAHSTGDVIVHVPEKKILFIGDLFSTYGRINFLDVERMDVESWLPALDWIEARMNAIDIIVGGHGAILSIYDLQSFIERVRNKYFAF